MDRAAGGPGPEVPEPEVSSVARGVSALTAGVRDIESGIADGVLGGARAVAQAIPLVLALILLAPRLALAAFAVLAPFAWLVGRARRRWKRANARAAAHGEALLEAADDAVRHADLWRTYGAEGRARAQLARLGAAAAQHGARLAASAAASTGANEVLGALALVLALLAARAGWLGDAAGGGALLPFVVVFFLLYRPARELADARLAAARGAAAVDRIAHTLGASMSSGGRSDMATAVAGPGRAAGADGWPLAPLEIRSLRLARGADAPVSVRVGAGEIVAIQGPTGVGKTTLLRTLLGLDAAMDGDIVYGGSSLALAPPGPEGRPFAWVPQDAPLLVDTLDANVGLGARDVSTRAVLEPLGAGHLVDALGDDRLGAGARAVSGGERQWIGIARALATRLPVLLLDEPTSGLDAASQAHVLAAIARLRGLRTVVMVTHRPEPIAIADHVLRLTA